MWGRLGYPRRALRLRECAVAIVERHGGVVPDRPRRAAGAAGRRRVHGAGGGGVRVRPAPTGGRHQRPPVGGPGGGRRPRRRAGHPTGRPGRHRRAAARPSRRGRPGRARPSWSSARWSAPPASPRCAACPVEAVCAWRAAGQPAPTGPSRRPQQYAGTDRQVRGLLLEVLRDATGPVPRTAAGPGLGRRRPARPGARRAGPGRAGRTGRRRRLPPGRRRPVPPNRRPHHLTRPPWRRLRAGRRAARRTRTGGAARCGARSDGARSWM